MKTGIFTNTRGGKAGAIDGLNLFFGALLGANLGTLDHLGLGDYIQLIILLAGTVMALRMISTSERRIYMFAVLGVYGVILTALVSIPRLKPEGMSVDDLHRLIATLAIWITFVLAAELSPVKEESTPPIPDEKGQA